MTRDGAVWKLVGLITRRSQVQILLPQFLCSISVTIQQPLSREVFWHIYAKIPRHTSKNAITEGDFKCIFARNCEGTEQLPILNKIITQTPSDTFFLCRVVFFYLLLTKKEE